MGQVPKQSLIHIGQIGGARGLRGEVKVQLWSHNPDSLECGSVYILRRGAEPELKTIARIRGSRKGWFLQFDDVNNRTDAERLRGSEIAVEPDQLRELEDGEYFHYQLIGLRVIDIQGELLGAVVDVRENPGHDLLIIEHQGKQSLVPMVEAFVRDIDLEKGTLCLQPIEGLLDG